MYYFKYITAAIFMITISCEKEIPFKEEESASRLVVQAELTQADTNYCLVSQSVSILSNDFSAKTLSNAKVEIFENDVKLGEFVEYNPLTRPGVYYYSNLVLTPLTNYKLVVSHPDFESAESSFTMPSKANDIEYSYEISERGTDLHVAFTDQANEINNYGISVYYTGTSTYYDYELEDSIEVTYDDYFICTQETFFDNTANINGKFCGLELLFDDKNKDGSRISFTLEKGVGSGDTLNIQLNSYSEGIIKHRLSLDKYWQTEGNFFAEPVQVYSNFTNGFGIFGGYWSYEKELVLE
ncbi:DUF4249 domain-containing protein [Crocinitomix catalasitica]|uniref:DUF4249 domain-containing protein n=1 Tax=Crocinitomix catalasitica TaxID=184607 RepID=UPI00146FB389|nr:DUF4249 domain-containing protein [Crocinitomix catalasitica]